VHLGHQKIFARVAEEAGLQAAAAMAVTFEPHPVRVLAPDRSPRLLTPHDEKARLLRRYGMDTVLFINFTREFAGLRPDDFIREVLVSRLSPKAVIVGHGYAFGKGKRGTTEILRRRGKKHGFKVQVVRSAVMYGKVVSSSRIRNLITIGKVAKASTLLGRPYSIDGMVVRGAGRGARLLDTPTANIKSAYEVLPREGVYAVRVAMDDRSFGRIYDGVANIGTNPTFKGKEQSLEVHVFGYSGDILGKAIRVGFIDRLRDEHTFPSAEALRVQIQKDISKARDVLSGTAALRM
jgi:riboflavin kinase/FMN adenylyltransferase